MKNKIIAITLLVAVIIPMFNFLNAASISDFDVLQGKDESGLQDLLNKYSISLDNGYLITINSIGNPTIYIAESSGGFFHLGVTGETNKSNILYYNLNGSNGYYYNFSFNQTGNNKWYDFGKITNQSSSKWNSSIKYTSQSSILNHSTGETVFNNDTTIGDPNSNLVLSYEYNEDNTECHINATLKNGAFTDKIYYSNLPPSIAGQGLLTKKGFPVERFNSYRKSIFVFPSRR